MRRSAALEAAGWLEPVGVLFRADDEAFGLDGVKHELNANATANAASSFNPSPS